MRADDRADHVEVCVQRLDPAGMLDANDIAPTARMVGRVDHDPGGGREDRIAAIGVEAAVPVPVVAEVVMLAAERLGIVVASAFGAPTGKSKPSAQSGAGRCAALVERVRITTATIAVTVTQIMPSGPRGSKCGPGGLLRREELHRDRADRCADDRWRGAGVDDGTAERACILDQAASSGACVIEEDHAVSRAVRGARGDRVLRIELALRITSGRIR